MPYRLQVENRLKHLNAHSEHGKKHHLNQHSGRMRQCRWMGFAPTRKTRISMAHDISLLAKYSIEMPVKGVDSGETFNL